MCRHFDSLSGPPRGLTNATYNVSIYIMRNGVLTLLCALAVYQWLSLHRKRTGQCS